MSPRTLSRVLTLAAMLLAVACSDSTTAPAPRPGAALTIVPPPAVVYETDAVQFTATVRDASGNPVPNPSITWEVSDPTRAELASNGVVTALKAGAVTITGRSNGATGSYTLEIARLTVQEVIVLPPVPQLALGDVTPIGVKVQGAGARLVPGRVVTLTSDNPSVASIDAAGRLRAVSPGTATIRATADGVVGTARVDVIAENAAFELRTADGARLPQLVASDTVMWDGVPEFHEVWRESGSLRLTGAGQPRYELEIKYAEYKVATVNGQRTMELRLLSREFDRGVVTYDSRGDLHMTSELISPLSHTAISIAGGFQMRYRIPGTDEYLDLFYRREVK